MVQSDGTSDGLRRLLCEAGWSPDRQVEIAEWIRILESEGFVPNAIALAILKEFGGLSVRVPPFGANRYEHLLRFDPVRAATGESDRAKDWKDELGIDLFPLGEEVSSGYVLWVGNYGRIYYGRGFGLCLLGESFPKAMDSFEFLDSSPVRVAE